MHAIIPLINAEKNPIIKEVSSISVVKVSIELKLSNNLIIIIPNIGIRTIKNENFVASFLFIFNNKAVEIVIPDLEIPGKIAIDWGVYGIPETFVVNSKGIIKYRHVGPITNKEYKKINLLIEKIK